MRDPADLYGDPRRVLERVIAATDNMESHEGEPAPDTRRGALYYRQTASREIVLYPLIAGTVRIVVGDVGAQGYDDAWCYSTPVAGLVAASCWDGEGDPPDGWFRNISTARRRPEGDPAREYIER